MSKLTHTHANGLLKGVAKNVREQLAYNAWKVNSDLFTAAKNSGYTGKITALRAACEEVSLLRFRRREARRCNPRLFVKETLWSNGGKGFQVIGHKVRTLRPNECSYGAQPLHELVVRILAEKVSARRTAKRTALKAALQTATEAQRTRHLGGSKNKPFLAWFEHVAMTRGRDAALGLIRKHCTTNGYGDHTGCDLAGFTTGHSDGLKVRILDGFQKSRWGHKALKHTTHLGTSEIPAILAAADKVEAARKRKAKRETEFAAALAAGFPTVAAHRAHKRVHDLTRDDNIREYVYARWNLDDQDLVRFVAFANQPGSGRVLRTRSTCQRTVEEKIWMALVAWVRHNKTDYEADLRSANDNEWDDVNDLKPDFDAGETWADRFEEERWEYEEARDRAKANCQRNRDILHEKFTAVAVEWLNQRERTVCTEESSLKTPSHVQTPLAA